VKGASPSRYQVDRIGTPDPDNCQYYVLDVVNDAESRFILRRLVRSYRVLGASIKADELEDFLDSTQAAHVASVEERNPPQKKKRK
jgi:hypothetical protein